MIQIRQIRRCNPQIEHVQKALRAQQVVWVEVCKPFVFRRDVRRIKTLRGVGVGRVSAVWADNIRSNPVVGLDKTILRWAGCLTRDQAVTGGRCSCTVVKEC